MYEFCICCKIELTEDNSYRNSFSCKQCQKECNKKRRRPHLSQKLVKEILQKKACCICNENNDRPLFFITKQNLYSRTVKQVQSLDAVHIDCLISSNKKTDQPNPTPASRSPL